MPYPILKTRLIKHSKRLGRGLGGGKGKTSGRGHKGQYARTGKKIKPFFESGAIEMFRRLPKKGGFTRHWVIKPTAINISNLKSYKQGETVDLSSLKAKHLIPKYAVAFKILSKGDLPHALIIATDLISAKAKAKLEAAGCQFSSPKQDKIKK